MTAIYRGVVRAYSFSTHKATVQPVAALATTLVSVPVATNIKGGEVVPNRECAVLQLTDDNPDDGMLVALYNAIPTNDVWDTTGAKRIDVGILGVRFDENISVNRSVLGNARIAVIEDKAISGTNAMMDYQMASTQSANNPDLAGVPALSYFLLMGRHDISDGVGTAYNLGTVGALVFRYAIDDNVGGGVVDENAPLYWDSQGDTATITEQWAADVKNWPNGYRQRQLDRINRLAGNVQLFKDADDFGGGVGVLGIANAGTNPTANPTNGGILYANGGALTYRGSGGTTTVIAVA